MDRHDQLAALTERYLTMEQQYSKNKQSQQKQTENQYNLFSGLPETVKTDHVHLVCDDDNNIGGDFSEINDAEEHLPKCEVSGSSSFTRDMYSNIDLPSKIENSKLEPESDSNSQNQIAELISNELSESSEIRIPPNIIPSDDWTDMLRMHGDIGEQDENESIEAEQGHEDYNMHDD